MGRSQIGVAEQRFQCDRLRSLLLLQVKQVEIRAQRVAADRQIGGPIEQTGLPGMLGGLTRLIELPCVDGQRHLRRSGSAV